jgi:lysine-N-methylase
MKLRVLESERFSCHGCTNCCRDWHVELTPAEVTSVPRLAWPGGDALAGADVILRHGGKTFLAHRADGACVFLNASSGLCRIHEHFGEAAKPLGCRLYPFQITPTFAGQAAATARFDCPTVRANSGAPHADQLPALRALAAEITFPPAFNEFDCCGMSPDQLQAIVEFVVTVLPGLDSDVGRALFLHRIAEVLGSMSPATRAEELDRAALAAAFPALRDQVSAALAADAPRPSAAVRLSFRALLGQYLRRDEDVLNGRASRVGRAAALARVVAGGGSLAGLGRSYPRVPLRDAGLFSSAVATESDAFAPFWRMIRVKLESLQFMGAAGGGRNFIEGLRSLALLYPLARAVARFHAVARAPAEDGRITREDASQATAAIEHAHGRSPVLRQSHARSMEGLLLSAEVFPKLVRHV